MARLHKKTKKLGKFLAKAILFIAFLTIAVILLCVFAKNEAEKTDEAESETLNADTEDDANEEETSDSELVIVIDAGHGFGDVGNESGYLENNEAFYTILYAAEIAEKLEALGATVYLTHDGETYPSEDYLTSAVAEYGIVFSSPAVCATADDNLFNKYERVMYASILNYEYGVDFFLSVHFNSNESSEVSGTAIYYCESNSDPELCQTFCEAIMEQVGYSSSYSGIYATSYEDSYAILRYGSYPSVLIECAFMTNWTDAMNIGSYTWRDWFTTLVAESIMDALSAQESE